MSKLLRVLVAGLLVAGVGFQASTVSAATAPAAAPKMTAAKPAATGTPATGVVCKVVTSGKYVHIQAVNTGTAAVTKGSTFAFVIVGPTKKTSETWTFKGDLPAGKSVTITKAIKVAAVASCTPAS